MKITMQVEIKDDIPEEEFIATVTKGKSANKIKAVDNFREAFLNLIRDNSNYDFCCIPSIAVDFNRVSEEPQSEAKWVVTDWVKYDDQGQVILLKDEGLKCSRCLVSFKRGLLHVKNYCPNCGRKMKK